MAIIQMISEEVIDVTEDAEAVASAIERSRAGLIRLEAEDDNGTRPIWINAAQIGSFMDSRDAGSPSSTKDHPWR